MAVFFYPKNPLRITFIKKIITFGVDTLKPKVLICTNFNTFGVGKMGAALLNWIHDNSMDQQFVDRWNKASKSERNALLKAAGRDSIHRFKAWDYVPADVRVDVVHIIELQAKNQPKPATTPKTAHREMWYDKY